MKNNIQYLYASIGSQLSWYAPNLKTYKLEFRGVMDFGSNVQYIWPHPQKDIAYMALSDGGPGKMGSQHSLVACSIDRSTGCLTILSPKRSVPYRPIHLCTDENGENLLTAYNNPSSLSLHKLNQSGCLEKLTLQLTEDDVGIFGHQVRITPDGKTVILVCRGYDAIGNNPEQPGCLKLFHIQDGRLQTMKTIKPSGGIGFGARHLDFHPNGTCLYLAVERQSELHTFKILEGKIADNPLFKTSTLSKPVMAGARQANSAIHVHPSGKFVYVSNRTYAIAPNNDAPLPDGEDNIAVFKINQLTCKPTLIQAANTFGSLPRTFSIHNSGKMLVAGNSEGSKKINSSGTISNFPLSLISYEIKDDGKLEVKQQIELKEKGELLFWAGFL